MYAYYILSFKGLGLSPILSIFFSYLKYLYLLVVKRVTLNFLIITRHWKAQFIGY